MTLLPSHTWADTHHGSGGPDGVVFAHRTAAPPPVSGRRISRLEREHIEDLSLVIGATRASGAGDRAIEEEPDELRTCFERDRDRILHAAAFRRLAGKTQVFVFPDDHARTRLTHALEVAQVATSIARACGMNVTLTEAIALGHDCGHGPGGHASEDAFEPFLPEGFHHAVWGADVVLTPLNLCSETLDGIRNHSWSRPTPQTPEAICVAFSDRIAYTGHDLEDAIRSGIVSADDLPADVVGVVGSTSRAKMITAFIDNVVDTVVSHGVVGMDSDHMNALASMRRFNYERIYSRPASVAQGDAVIAVLHALVEFFATNDHLLPSPLDATPDPVRAAVTYVGGMTDRFAFDSAVRLLDWPTDRLPRGIDVR